MTKKDSIASRMIERRAMLGWSQSFLAKMSGVAPAQISRYEREEMKPSVPVMAKLADALTVPFGWLASGDETVFVNKRNEKGEVPHSIELNDDIDKALEEGAAEAGIDKNEFINIIIELGLSVRKLNNLTKKD